MYACYPARSFRLSKGRFPPKGEALAMKLAGLQTTRIARALAELGPDAHDMACRFLAAMINSEHRDSVLRSIARADRGRRKG